MNFRNLPTTKRWKTARAKSATSMDHKDIFHESVDCIQLAEVRVE
jgi:hypothetical protein